ncbi:hypothetical protein D3C86_2131580 [compost metagenome]
MVGGSPDAARVGLDVGEADGHAAEEDVRDEPSAQRDHEVTVAGIPVVALIMIREGG